MDKLFFLDVETGDDPLRTSKFSNLGGLIVKVDDSSKTTFQNGGLQNCLSNSKTTAQDDKQFLVDSKDFRSADFKGIQIRLQELI